MSFLIQYDPAKQPRCKVELHVHLDGAMRLTTIWELAQKKSIDIHAKTLDDLYRICRITKPSTLANFLKPFDIFMPVVIGDKDAIERIAYEVCEDAVKQGVFYMEVRYSPHLLSASHGTLVYNVNHALDEEVTPRVVVESVNKGLKAAEEKLNLTVRSILCCFRGHSEWSNEVLKLCQDFKNEGVVAIDIVGDEAACMASPQDIAVFKKAAELGIHRTVHAAEAGPASNVTIAVEEMLAERIGHGYHVVDDWVLYQRCLASDLHFEACPYSSYLTGSVPLSTLKHPIVRYAEDDANFSLNRDDPVIIGKTLDEEYNLLRQMGLKDVHFTRANFNAARSCFLPNEEKKKLLNDLKLIYGVYELETSYIHSANKGNGLTPISNEKDQEDALITGEIIDEFQTNL